MSKITTVTLPDIGEGVVDGEVLEWLKNVGDKVQKDEPVVVIMTDKATVELPALESGIISKHYYNEGALAIKDKPLYDIETASTPCDNIINKHPLESTSNEIVTITLPDIGEGIVDGEVLEWLKNVGDDVAKDEPVVTIVTDKATVDLPSPHNGKLFKQYFKSGEMAIKDRPLYDIEIVSTSKTTTKPAKKQGPKIVVAPDIKKTKPTITKSTGGGVLATPATRKIAKDMGIDISNIVGTGKDGRVTNDDLRSFVSSADSQRIKNSTPVNNLPGDERIPIKGIRKVIAEKMVEAKYIVPHATYCDKIDITELVAFRKKMKEESGDKITFMPFFIKALSMVLDKYPILNSSIDLTTNEIVIHKQHNIGIIVKGPEGAIAPVLKNVRNKSLNDIVKEYNTLIGKVKHNELSSNDIKNSTITISNFGTVGGIIGTPIVNYPEAAILGISKMERLPVVKDNQIVIRDIMHCCWGIDHRIIDGDVVAAASNKLITLLEEPQKLAVKKNVQCNIVAAL